MDEQYGFIRSIYNIKEADYQLFIKSLKPIKFGKGEYITLPGQTANKLFLVKKGLQMYYFDTDNKVSVLGFTYPRIFVQFLKSFCKLPFI